MKIAFVPDGGPRSGLGHVARCVAIAHAFRAANGVKPVFAIGDPGCATWIRDHGFEARPSLRGSWDVVVLDSYSRSKAIAARLRSQASVFAVIDDFGQAPSSADWVINTSAGAVGVSYAGCRAKGFLLGPKFHPLRREFLRGARPPGARKTVRDVLVSMGATGGGSGAGKIVRQVRRTLPSVAIHVVVGPFDPGVEGADERVILHRSPPDMKRILSKVDIAVSAGGQTLYELAYMGIPTLAVEIAANQKANINGFSDAGFITALGRSDDRELMRRLNSTLAVLSRNPRKRRAMSEAGRAMVDGLGGKRLAMALIP